MREADIINQVRRPFGYLFDDYDYKVIAARRFANSGNWTVVLESPSCGRFLVLQDRGEIIVALGTHGSPSSATDSQWFDLAVVVEHLSRGADMVENGSGDPDQQMVRFATALRPYMDQIGPLFTSAGFHRAEDNLNRIGARREDEIWNQELGGQEGDG